MDTISLNMSGLWSFTTKVWPFPPAIVVKESIPALSLFIKSFKNLTAQTLGWSQPDLFSHWSAPPPDWLAVPSGKVYSVHHDLVFWPLLLWFKTEKNICLWPNGFVSYTKLHKSESTLSIHRSTVMCTSKQTAHIGRGWIVCARIILWYNLLQIKEQNENHIK